MTRVVFALERDIKTDPPEDQNLAYPTDRGVGVTHPTTGAWLDIALLRPFDPQPSWWYDLRHAEGEGVATDDLESVLEAAEWAADEADGLYMSHRAEIRKSAARLRAAIDAPTRKEDKYQ